LTASVKRTSGRKAPVDSIETAPTNPQQKEASADIAEIMIQKDAFLASM